MGLGALLLRPVREGRREDAPPVAPTVAVSGQPAA